MRGVFNLGCWAELVLCVSHKDTSPRPVGQGWVKTHVQSMDVRNSSLQKVCGVGWALGDGGTHCFTTEYFHTCAC